MRLLDSIHADKYFLFKTETNFMFKSLNDLVYKSDNNDGLEEGMKKFDPLHTKLYENNQVFTDKNDKNFRMNT